MEIKTSKWIAVKYLFWSLLLFSVVFYAGTWFKCIEILFGNSTWSIKLDLMGKTISSAHSNNILSKMFDAGAWSKGWILFVMAFGLLIWSASYFYRFAKRFFDSRAQLSMGQEGLFIRTIGTLPWDSLKRIHVGETIVNYNDGDGGGGSYREQYLNIYPKEGDVINIPLKNLDWSELENFLRVANTNTELTIESFRDNKTKWWQLRKKDKSGVKKVKF